MGEPSRPAVALVIMFPVDVVRTGVVVPRLLLMASGPEWLGHVSLGKERVDPSPPPVCTGVCSDDARSNGPVVSPSGVDEFDSLSTQVRT